MVLAMTMTMTAGQPERRLRHGTYMSIPGDPAMGCDGRGIGCIPLALEGTNAVVFLHVFGRLVGKLLGSCDDREDELPYDGLLR
jgi:hypothetical protein